MNIYKPGSFQNYGDLISNSPYKVKSREDLLALLPTKYAPNNICEFGCGNGNNLIYFGNKLNLKKENLFGIDICKSSDIIKDSFNFLNLSLEEFMKINEKKFDLIIFSDVLEHIYNPWKIFENISEHLSNNGIILISVPNLQNLKYIDAITTGNFYYEATGLFDQTHIRFFSTNTLTDYLAQSNFEIINNNWRPDQSIMNLKNQILNDLKTQNSVALNLSVSQLTINAENIENFFGQQILICAKKINV